MSDHQHTLLEEDPFLFGRSPFNFFFLFVSLLIADKHDFQLQLHNYASTFLNPCWQEYPITVCMLEPRHSRDFTPHLVYISFI